MVRQTRARALAAAGHSSTEISQSTRRSRRSIRKIEEIQNSTDFSSDEVTNTSGEALNNGLSANHWPKVIVPLKRHEHMGSTTSSISSDTSHIFRDSPFAGQDTPLTSAMATPLEASSRRSLRGRPAAENLSTVNQMLSTSANKIARQPSAKPSVSQTSANKSVARKIKERKQDSQQSSVKRTYERAQNNQSDYETDELLSDLSEVSGSLPPLRKRKSGETRATYAKRQRLSLKSPIGSVSLNAISRRKVHTARALPFNRTGTEEEDDDDLNGITLAPRSFQSDESVDSSDEFLLTDISDLSEPSLINFDFANASTHSSGKGPRGSKTSKAIKARLSKAQAASNRILFRESGESRSNFERRRLEVAHPKLKTLWDDLATVPVIKPHKTPQPEGINITLKSFQLEGVDWMRRMETESQWKGGLLGDEMGMGKTIQAVSLIMSDYPADKPTLVVVPPVALMQWSQEIKAYTDGKLKVLVHHNTDPKVRTLKVHDLMKYDVIMISYSGLESMHRKEVKGWKRDDGLVKENSRIHAIHFHRLILDEAHSIKTRTTQVAKACFALKANHKWCLSGTPVQNRIGEFFSLLRFLEVEPFASYFCKDCDCESLHWSQDESGKCVSCQHTGFNHVSLFNQELLNPITSGSLDDRAMAMSKLRLLTDRIMLRRMKRDHTSSMELPPKSVVIHNEFFGPEERDFSRSIMTNTTRTYDTYVARGVTLNNYANIFGLIMQMRQVANHPDLILKKHAHGGQNVLVCCICDEPAEEPIRSQCHHEFCRRCARDYVLSYVKNGDDPDCPRCHINLRIDLDQPDIEQDEDIVKKSSIINRIKMDDWHSSSKIEMLVSELFQLRSQKRTTKSIVFSQFTSMLQLVEWRLRRAGFSTVMLDGSMSPAQRQNSIDHFMKNVDVEIFLVSLKAGGVALNLTQASRVFIVDPWWNPAAEWQSADRCHRIGQRRSCKITRLCIEDSVESRMVLLQEKKANLINGTVNGDDVALGKLTPEDLQFLFRGT